MIQNNLLLCQRNTYYFNETFADEELRTGNATLYGPAEGDLPESLEGVYRGADGLSASGVMLGYNPELCGAAASNVDPKALR